MSKIKLSLRVRPDCEAAPWVIEEIKLLEAQVDLQSKRIDWTVSDNAKKAIQIDKLQAQVEQAVETIDSMDSIIALVAESLGVTTEPHQTFNERLLDAAKFKAAVYDAMCDVGLIQFDPSLQDRVYSVWGFSCWHHDKDIFKAIAAANEPMKLPAALKGESCADLLALVQELTDPDPCRYDHHGYCQTHFLHEKPCPHERAKELINQ